jgi:hypothetical protein
MKGEYEVHVKKRATIVSVLVVALLAFSAGIAYAATINCTAGVTCNGTSSADTINGTSSADDINANAGDDSVFGNGGVDTVNGGQNNDTLRGNAGGDTLSGDLGNDDLQGGNGNDTINARAPTGDDADTIDCGADTDVANVDGSNTSNTETSILGCETVNYEIADADGDTVPDGSDNCPNVANSGQQNNDGDSQGDACDTDDDNDTVADGSDNCVLVANTAQTDSDGDGQGNACDSTQYGPGPDSDDDDDGRPDDTDFDPQDPNVQDDPNACSGTNITTSQNLASIVNAENSDGGQVDTFCVQDGTHLMSAQVNLGVSDRIIGVYSDGSRPILDGQAQVDTIIDPGNSSYIEGITVKNSEGHSATNLCRPACGRGIGAGGNNVTLINIRATENPNSGVGSMGGGLLIEDSVLDNNGFDEDHKTQGQPVSAAGIKSTQGFTIRDSIIRDNDWVGVWKDVDTFSDPMILENVEIYDNLKTGVSYEITATNGTPSSITGSTIQGNGYGDTFSREAEILIASSNDIEITGNTFGDTAANAGNLSDKAVLIYEDSRPPEMDESTIVVHDNEETGGGATDTYSCDGPNVDNPPGIPCD